MVRENSGINEWLDSMRAFRAREDHHCKRERLKIIHRRESSRKIFPVAITSKISCLNTGLAQIKLRIANKSSCFFYVKDMP